MDSIMDLFLLLHHLFHNHFFIKFGLIGLFFNGLFSSIIPIPTELTVSALITGGTNKLIIAIILGSSSIIGGIIAYYIGASGNKVFSRLHKKPKQDQEEHGHKLLNKYGWLVIFGCSWIPILGDVIPIIAGTKRYDFKKFFIAMSVGKMLKIIFIIFIIGLLIK
jgi:membrane protein YqaA with SNARE-associated domain